MHQRSLLPATAVLSTISTCNTSVDIIKSHYTYTKIKLSLDHYSSFRNIFHITTYLFYIQILVNLVTTYNKFNNY